MNRSRLALFCAILAVCLPILISMVLAPRSPGTPPPAEVIPSPEASRQSTATLPSLDEPATAEAGAAPLVPPTNPDARREWLRRRIGEPENGRILIEAKRQLERMAAEERARIAADGSAGKKDGGIWAWEWLGPGNVGGRVRTILTDPADAQHLLTAGVTGGVWESNDWGGSWTPNTNLIANLSITSLVRDPVDPGRIYAGSGESVGSGTDGGGIFRSLNGGTSWYQLPNTIPTGIDDDPFEHVNRLAHHPSELGHVFAGTEEGLYETTNSGTNWSADILGVPDGVVMDIDFDPFDADRMMVGSRQGAYLSEDGGATWTWVTDGLHGPIGPSVGRCEIAFARSSPGLVYMNVNQNGGELWRSLDGGFTWGLTRTGDNWFETSPGRSQGNYDNAIWVSPIDANLVVVGGIDLWRSLDGGFSFVRISDWSVYHTGQSAHADQHVIVEDVGYNGSTNRIVFVGNDGGVQTANDIRTVGQRSGWTNLANNLGITQFYSGSASRDGFTIVGGTQDNYMQRYHPNDGVQGWYQSTTGDGGFVAVHPDDANIVYGETQYMNIVKSVDGGNSFAAARNGLSEAGDPDLAPFIAPLVMDPNDSETLIAGGTMIWRTTDGAANWSPIRVPTPPLPLPPPNNNIVPKASAIDIADGDSDNIWVGYEFGEIARHNPDDSWTVVDPTLSLGTVPSGTVTDIAINPFDHDEVFVTLGSYLSRRVWFTDDAGATWQGRWGAAADTIPAMPIHSVRFHPDDPNWVYLGTELGVLASENKGLSWSVLPAFGSNEGPLNVAVHELFWQGDFLIAATHGRGMYRTRPLNGLVVTNANDSGLGSLRAAIETANADPDLDTISFAIFGMGPHTIQLATRLPTIIQPVVIDGSTQLGYASNTQLENPGYNAILPIVIDAGGVDGLRVFADDCEVRGLQIQNANRSVWVDENTSVVEGCRIIDSSVGIRLSGRGNRIGDVSAVARNSIQNCAAGIRVTSGDVNSMVGNRILGSSVLAIDLGPAGVVNPNDPDDSDSGPNHGVNFPDLTSASRGPQGLRIQGSMVGPEAKTYSVHFYASTACDPLGHGGADAYLGTADYTPGRSGSRAIDILLDIDVPEGHVVSATATVAGEGTSEFSNCVTVEEDVTAVDGPAPRVTRLGLAVPNPFNPRTEIHFELARGEAVRLEIYDVRGRRVRTLLGGAKLPAGRHSRIWHGDDDRGVEVASGSYRVRLVTSAGAESRAVALVR